MLMKDDLERLSATHTRFNLRYLPSKPGNHWEHLEEKDLVSSLPFRPSEGLGIYEVGRAKEAGKECEVLHEQAGVP